MAVDPILFSLAKRNEIPKFQLKLWGHVEWNDVVDFQLVAPTTKLAGWLKHEERTADRWPLGGAARAGGDFSLCSVY